MNGPAADVPGHGARRNTRGRAWLFIALATCPCALLNGWAGDTGERIVVQGIGGHVVACATCHGTRGEGGAEGAYPRLAGLPAAYTETQLKAFRGGGGARPLMS